MHRTALLVSRISICCVFFGVLLRAQTTINVPADQPTIQAGINAASNGATILVADGHYHEHINFNGKNITVTSVNGAQVTIIDGDVGTGPVVRLISNERRDAVLHGFTIEHGSMCCPRYEGGGIEIMNASPTITGNIITLNHGGGEGGGINALLASPLIDSNTISQNTLTLTGGTQGGGVSLRGSQGLLAEITNNKITGNWGVGMGGGIGLNAAGPVIVENNTISGNQGDWGGGFTLENAGAGEVVVQNLVTGNSALVGTGFWSYQATTDPPGFQVVNNTIANNSANTLMVVLVDGFNSNSQIKNNIIVTAGTEAGLLCNQTFHGGPPIVEYNDVFSSRGVDTAYAGDCTGFAVTNSNLSDDPLFVSSTDFHMLANSPAIDAGDNSAPNLPEFDLDGNPRIVDGHGTGTPIIDMGVYEFQACGGSSENANKHRLGIAKQGATP